MIVPLGVKPVRFLPDLCMETVEQTLVVELDPVALLVVVISVVGIS